MKTQINTQIVIVILCVWKPQSWKFKETSFLLHEMPNKHYDAWGKPFLKKSWT